MLSYCGSCERETQRTENEHLSAALEDEETGDGNMGQLVEAHLSSMRKVFHSSFPDLSELGAKLIPNACIVEVCFLSEGVHDDRTTPPREMRLKLFLWISSSLKPTYLLWIICPRGHCLCSLLYLSL